MKKLAKLQHFCLRSEPSNETGSPHLSKTNRRVTSDDRGSSFVHSSKYKQRYCTTKPKRCSILAKQTSLAYGNVPIHSCRAFLSANKSWSSAKICCSHNRWVHSSAAVGIAVVASGRTYHVVSSDKLLLYEKVSTFIENWKLHIKLLSKSVEQDRAYVINNKHSIKHRFQMPSSQ